ncbi:MAG: DegT/DnrJ/EryC1/StrS family aminotransferase [Acidimicrobiales bacterium]
MTRVYLSPPDVGNEERQALLRAFDSNWIAPLGPEVDAFEEEFARRLGVDHAVALSSGTAALHLALVLLGVGPGDDVLVPTFTFVATASTIKYVGAHPVLVDSDASTWELDPNLVEDELRRRARLGRLPSAVITVDLYGQCANYDPILEVCRELDVPVLEDAAEALGATYRGRPAGCFGEAGVFSFNGNKIVTTSGGGMLVTGSAELAARARHLATQARQPVAHYEHEEIGFNYRLSNLLAALGRAQLRGLDARIERRRQINGRYFDALSSLPGIEFMPLADYGAPNYWLTCLTVDPNEFGCDREAIRLALEKEDIEARATWKPLHMQPVFAGEQVIGGSVSESVFRRGLCLPSGSNLSDDDLDRIVTVITSSGTNR